MQHYGGPTRLLDWTECPFVGMYFALRDEPGGGSSSALWAIDLRRLEQKAQETLNLDESTLPAHRPARVTFLNTLLRESEKPLVVRIDPQRPNDRMVAQKGFFLWKMYEEIPFFDQMLMAMMLNPEIVQSPVIRKLEVSPELRSRFLERLFREKNVHEAALFPGRDFCEPLRIELRAMVESAKAEYEENLRAVQMGEVVR
jgi:FRG domain